MQHKISDWDEFWMRHVYLASSKSKDRSTEIGAILIKNGILISEGYNGICRKVNDEIKERSERPEKYHWYEHAERNSIYNAARHGIQTLDSVIFTNYPPCTDCARSIIQAGIKEVVCHLQYANHWDKIRRGNWAGHAERTLTMFKESGVNVRWFEKVLGIKCLISEQLCEV